MVSLLDKLKGTESSQESEEEFPDQIPQEWAEEYVQDPPPGAPGKPARRKIVTTVTSGAVTPAMRRRIAGEIEAYIEILAMPLILRDPVCGGALHEQAKPSADALAGILARYPDLAHKFLATGLFGDCVKVGLALKPFVVAVYMHHIVKRVDEEEAAPDDTTYPAYRPGA